MLNKVPIIPNNMLVRGVSRSRPRKSAYNRLSPIIRKPQEAIVHTADEDAHVIVFSRDHEQVSWCREKGLHYALREDLTNNVKMNWNA